MTLKDWKNSRISVNYSINNYKRKPILVVSFVEKSKVDYDESTKVIEIYKGKHDYFSGGHGVGLENQVSSKGYTLMISDIYTVFVCKYFNVKSVALKFAKSYMRKH